MAGRAVTQLVLIAFATPLLLVAATEGYTGREACQACHAAQFRQHIKTGHAGALRVAPAGSPGHWAFGAGLKAITYVSQTDPEHYTEHGLSYYPERKAMGVTPGHTDATGRSYRTLDPLATALRCFRCHSTGPVKLAVEGAEIQPSEQGVQCESCHGPGAEHVKRGGAAAAILNPKRLSAVELNDFCGSCHRKAEDVSDWSNSWNVRHEPAYLNQSACFRKSEGALSCLTCHDAHTPLSRASASYDGRCVTCHTTVRHRTPVGGGTCVGCHMPQVRTSAQLQFTNHWIGVYAKGRPLVPVRATTANPPTLAARPKITAPADPSSLRPVFEQALADAAGKLGANDPVVARRSADLGLFLRSIGELIDAAAALRSALAIDEAKGLPQVYADKENLASVLVSLQRDSEAAALLRDAAEGKDAAVAARSWSALASLDPANALDYYSKALDAEERAHGPDRPELAVVLTNLALTYRQKNENRTAEPLLRRALSIQQKALGPEHPATASTLSNLGSLLQSTGKLDEAERLERHALRIFQRKLGPQTAELATAYTNLADLLWTKGARAESVGLYRKALAADEFVYGAEHPEVAGDLTNLGLLLKEMGQTKEARELLQRGLAIFEKQLGSSSPQAVQARENLSALTR